MQRRRLLSQVRRELTPQRATLAPAVQSQEFPDLAAALAWVDHNGYRARIGGGYERGRSLVKIVQRGARLVIEEF